MRGLTVIDISCACGRESLIPHTPALAGLLRDDLLARLRCSACGSRPVDLKIRWETVISPEDQSWPL